MANTQDQTFIKKYQAEVHIKFEQNQSVLLNQTQVLRNIEGSTYRVPVAGAVDANTKARNADVTPLEVEHTYVDIALNDFYAPLYFDKLDQLKTNISFRDLYISRTVGAINRKIDDTIITALGQATATVGGSGVWTHARHMQAMGYLMDNNADEGDIVMVVAPKTYLTMMADDKLTNADYVGARPVESGKLGTLYGASLVRSTRLPLATTNRTNFYFNKAAVMTLLGIDPTTDVDWIAEKVAWLVNTYTSVGSKVIDNLGIVKFVTSEA